MLPDNSQLVNQAAMRQKILAARDRLSPLALEEKSLRITAQLASFGAFKGKRTVMFYASFRSEVQTGRAIAACLAAGVPVALPLTDPHRHRLLPYLVEDLGRDLRPGYCGIPEPDPSRTRPVSPDRLAAVVVPGSVFDWRGGRWGYGGGFYDRFLAREAPQALRIGVAFALQVVEGELPLAPHDQRLHGLVTEERAVCFTAGAGWD